MEYLNNVIVNVMPWPAYSTDLSLIEHLCNIMKTRPDRHENRPQNCAELIAAVQEKWEAIPQMQIQRLICSKRRRMVTCIGANGGHTRH